MTDLAADAKGTGWRTSGRSGRKWFRIEKGSQEFEDWLKFYKRNGKRDLAAVIEKCGFSFVFGPSPLQYGDQQLIYLNSQLEDAA